MIHYDIKDPDSICTVLSLIYDHETCKTQLYFHSIHSQTRVAPITSAVPFSVCTCSNSTVFNNYKRIIIGEVRFV